MNKTKWRIIPGFSNYLINEFGQIKTRIKRVRGLERILSGGEYCGGRISNGYHRIHIRGDNGKTYNGYSHVLVAVSFLGAAKSENLQVNHIDGNKLNNHVSNLEWSTPAENTQHAMLTGLKRTKISPEEVLEIRRMYLQTEANPTQIAEQFGISKTYAIGVIRCWYWDFIDPPLPREEYFKAVDEKERKLRSKSQSLSIKHNTRKLLPEQVKEIRRLWESKECKTRTEIANKYELNLTTVCDIIDYKIHKYLN